MEKTLDLSNSCTLGGLESFQMLAQKKGHIHRTLNHLSVAMGL